MKFFNLAILSTIFCSFVSADYYKASRITYYGGDGDEDSVKDPFCQDYSSKVDKYLRGTDYYVALSADILSKSNAYSYCGLKIKLKNAENGRSLTALVVDKCRSCGYGNVDLSVKAFKYLSDNHMSKGVLKQVSWCIEGGPSKFACPGSDSEKKSYKTTKKTTTTKKTSSSSSSSRRTAGGIYVELEKGKLYGKASKEKSIKYYSGSGYVRFTKAYYHDTTTKVKAYVNMKKSGKYNIIVKYNNPNSGSVYNRVIINNNVYKIKFSKTGNEWKKLTIKDVKFNSGSNTVEVKATDGYMSFDYIYIE